MKLCIISVYDSSHQALDFDMHIVSSREKEATEQGILSNIEADIAWCAPFSFANIFFARIFKIKILLSRWIRCKKSTFN